MQPSKRRLKLLIMVLSGIAVSGCMVGPNFHTPNAPQVSRYNEHPLPKQTAATPRAGKGGLAQTYVDGKDLPAEWWYLFHSQDINALVETGLRNSPNLMAAEAALRQAQENLNAQIGNLMFPAVDAALAGQRQRFNAASFGNEVQSSIFNLFNATVNVTYTLDVFGGSRRQLEALKAQVDYQQFQLIAAYLSLTSNIVTAAIATASLEEQIETTRYLIKSQNDQLVILQKQFDLGAISNMTVLTQRTLVDQTRATLPPLEQSLATTKHALSVLVGQFPNGPIPTINLEKLTLPAQLPVSLPSNLVRQRPDVRASEALLHVASANIGVATANLLPQFNLTGSYGWSSSVPNGLFGSSSNVWNYGGQIAQPIFHGGALLAQRRGAIDAYDQAAAQYRQTVLQAFQNVADALRAIETDARTLRAQKAAEVAAKGALDLTTSQFRLGGASYIDLLNAQQQYQQVVISRIQAQAARYADTAALFQALGGGWWNRKPVYPCDPLNPINASLTCP